jgi:hypothetical protein
MRKMKFCEYGPKVSSSICFRILNFLHKLQLGTIRQSVYCWLAFPAKYNVTLQLLGPIHNLRRELSFVKTVPGYNICNTSFSSYLINGHNKKECFSLASLSKQI